MESNDFAHLEVQEDDCQTFGKLTLRPYQQAAFNSVIEHVKGSIDPAVVVGSVGCGKTVIIAALCKHVSDKNGKTLVLSRQGEIVEQDASDCWLAECKNSLFSASLGVKSNAYPVIMGTEGTVWKALEQDLKYWAANFTGTPYGPLSQDVISNLNIDKTKEYKPSKLADYAPNFLQIDEAHMVNFMEPESQYMKIIAELYRRNPNIRIIGLTGTDYRGVTPIIGEAEEYFWRKKLIDIPTEYLTQLEYLVPCTFGFAHGDVGYDLSDFKSKGKVGTDDFTAEEMRQMEALMVKAETTTEKIMIEVMAKTKDRNCVMITCAGKRHCKEAAKFLPKGSYAIVTEDMGSRGRRKALKDAFDGKIKYLLQVGCLTTGLNIPLIDTIVILRKIGSLTLLVQLIGRGLRLLKDFQITAGIAKEDCLVLDYSDTMSELHELYENPILEEADLSKSRENNNTITCPKCGTENGENAVRCRGDNGRERCDYFFKSRACAPFYISGRVVNPGCGAENAPTARNCRICGNTLIDPNDNLSKKHYTDADFKPVLKFGMWPTKNNGVMVKYELPGGEIAEKFYTPFSDNKIAKRIFYNEFVKHHCIVPSATKTVRAARNAGELCAFIDMLNTVEAITHRINDKGKSVIAKYINKTQETPLQP